MSSSTRKVVFGRAVLTRPSTSIPSSLALCTFAYPLVCWEQARNARGVVTTPRAQDHSTTIRDRQIGDLKNPSNRCPHDHLGRDTGSAPLAVLDLTYFTISRGIRGLGSPDVPRASRSAAPSVAIPH